MKRRVLLARCALFALLATTLAGCGGEAASSFSKIGSGLKGGDRPASAYDSPGLTGPMAQATVTTGSFSDPMLGVAPAAGGERVNGFEAGGDTLKSGTYYQPQYQSPLTAGQVDDNAKYQEYLDYLRGYYGQDVEPINVSQRLFVRVLDPDQKPVAGARVQLFDGNTQVFDGQTVSDGRALFLPAAAGIVQASELRALITRGQTAVEAALKVGGPEQVVTLASLGDNAGAVGIDLVFLLDATGSMADEIDKINATVGSIAARIEQMPGSSAPRFGLVAYRDRGDEYVTRSWDFTSDVRKFSENLANVQASGGGDIPESVNAGLHDALNLQGWADNSTGRHLRMIVLVGDAPPHINYGNDYRYPNLLRQAVSQGIKIFPVGASNLDSTGEYIFRQFAQVTQGQFVFLTYANGVAGTPGVSTDKHVSDFSVQNLDNLIVNLVAGEVGNQTGQKISATNPAFVPVAVNVPATTAAVPVSGLQKFLDDLVGGQNSFFWAVILVVVALVVWATRTQTRARVAAEAQPQSPEIYVPENTAQVTYRPIVPRPAREHYSNDIVAEEEPELVMAAHLQPEIDPVELLLDVQPTRHPTVPLSRM
jgi:hypothetical protein